MVAQFWNNSKHRLPRIYFAGNEKKFRFTIYLYLLDFWSKKKLFMSSTLHTVFFVRKISFFVFWCMLTRATRANIVIWTCSMKSTFSITSLSRNYPKSNLKISYINLITFNNVEDVFYESSVHYCIKEQIHVSKL